MYEPDDTVSSAARTQTSTASVRTILPLAIVTCTSMLAMDLYLPAVPNLQASLGIDVTLAQATISLFLAGLAASQLVWGEALTRLGPRRCVQIGVSLLVAASVCSALAPNIETLLLTRFVQGIAAGAATVVAPSVIRATLPGPDAVRGIAAVSMVEALVPAAGPVIGAVLLTYTDWRGTFWLLSGLTLLVLPFVVRAAPRALPGLDRAIDAKYSTIIANRKYRQLALSHALSVGALLTFIASAPQLLTHALNRGPAGFAILQVSSVAVFMLVASQSGRISERLGPARAVQWGAAIQLGLCVVTWVSSFLIDLSLAAVTVFWCIFCGALAVRGPSAFSEALSVPASQMGRASAMLVLSILAAGAVGTQLIAPHMDRRSTVPLMSAMLAFSMASLWLVVPYPKGEKCS